MGTAREADICQFYIIVSGYRCPRALAEPQGQTQAMHTKTNEKKKLIIAPLELKWPNPKLLFFW